MKHFSSLPEAPAAIGPYSVAVSCQPKEFLFFSGQIPIDPTTGELVGSDIEVQTRQVLRNISAALMGVGAGWDQIVKTTIFLTDMKHFPAVNALYGELVGSNPPARSTVAVAGLPKGALIEIEVIVVR